MIEKTIKGIKYRLDEDALTAEVIQKRNYDGDIIVPEAVVLKKISYRVTSIGEGAFSDCTSISSIVIPDSVTTIGDYAFYNCSALTAITIPNSVTSIGDAAFEDCNNLKAIYVPKKKVDYYKKRFPADMYWLIVEEGSDFPVKP